MSWNNVLPWWVYSVAYEHDIAKMACAFEEEWFSGTSKELPDHVISISPATFTSWLPGGWNHGEEE